MTTRVRVGIVNRQIEIQADFMHVVDGALLAYLEGGPDGRWPVAAWAAGHWAYFYVLDAEGQPMAERTGEPADEYQSVVA